MKFRVPARPTGRIGAGSRARVALLVVVLIPGVAGCGRDANTPSGGNPPALLRDGKYDFTALDGAPLPAQVDSFLAPGPGGAESLHRVRITEGEVEFSQSLARYTLSVTARTYRVEPGGGEVVVSNDRTSDRGASVPADPGPALSGAKPLYELQSELYAGLRHTVSSANTQVLLSFRQPGTDDRYSLSLTRR